MDQATRNDKPHPRNRHKGWLRTFLILNKYAIYIHPINPSFHFTFFCPSNLSNLSHITSSIIVFYLSQKSFSTFERSKHKRLSPSLCTIISDIECGNFGWSEFDRWWWRNLIEIRFILIQSRDYNNKTCYFDMALYIGSVFNYVCNFIIDRSINFRYLIPLTW